VLLISKEKHIYERFARVWTKPWDLLKGHCHAELHCILFS